MINKINTWMTSMVGYSSTKPHRASSIDSLLRYKRCQYQILLISITVHSRRKTASMKSQRDIIVPDLDSVNPLNMEWRVLREPAFAHTLLFLSGLDIPQQSTGDSYSSSRFASDANFKCGTVDDLDMIGSARLMAIKCGRLRK